MLEAIALCSCSLQYFEAWRLMPPTHQRFKDLKERRISLGPWLCKLSEPSELSALSVPGSLDCWFPGSLIDLWLPWSRTVWSQGGRKHSGRSMAPLIPDGLVPGRPETFRIYDLGPRTQNPGLSPRSSGSRLRGPKAHGTRATGCLTPPHACEDFSGPPPLL